jgi:hypothetical protein
VAEDLLPILTRFHREVVLPDVGRIVGEVVGDLEARMNAHFDAIYKRFDKLETEYHMEELKARVDGLQSQIRVLEERLST